MTQSEETVRTDPREASERPLLVAHIGPHKTGSTSLQTFLAEHEEALAEAGFVYPRAGRIGTQHAGIPGIYLTEHRSISSAQLEMANDEVLPAMRAEVGPGQAAVVSSEVFWELLTYHPPQFEELLDRLAEDWQVLPLYYWRDPHGKAWSAVKHLGRVTTSRNPVGQYRSDTRSTGVAETRLLARHPESVRVDYSSDSIATLVDFLRTISPDGAEPSPEQLARLDAIYPSRPPKHRQIRVNTTLSNDYAAAVTLVVAGAVPFPRPATPEAIGLTALYERLFRTSLGGWGRRGLPDDRTLGERIRRLALDSDEAEPPLFTPAERQAVLKGLSTRRVRWLAGTEHRASLDYALECLRSALS